MVKKELHSLKMEDVAIYQERQKRIAARQKLEIITRENERAKACSEMHGQKRLSVY